MPIPEGPDGPGTFTPRFFTSQASGGANQHGTLEDISDHLATAEERFLAVKHLRVLRASLYKALPFGQYFALGPQWYAAYSDPRLSRVAEALQISTISNQPWHVDIDWFGPPGENWWDGEPDGRVLLRMICNTLLNVLEGSLGLPFSGPAPSSWKWGKGVADGIAGLNSVRGPRGRADRPLVIEWELDPAQSTFQVSKLTNADGIHIRTPVPWRPALPGMA